MNFSLKRFSGILRYSMVGVVNTATDFAVFSVLHFVFEFGPIWANTIAFAVAVTQSYLLNAFWTFKRSAADINGRAYLYFVTINLGCLFVSDTTIYLLQDVASALVAKLLATGFVLLWGFFLAKRFVFKSLPRIEVPAGRWS